MTMTASNSTPSTETLAVLTAARELGRAWAEVEHDSCQPEEDYKFAVAPVRPEEAVDVLLMHDILLTGDATSQCAVHLCLTARRERWAELLAEKTAEQAADADAERDESAAGAAVSLAAVLAAVAAQRGGE